MISKTSGFLLPLRPDAAFLHTEEPAANRRIAIEDILDDAAREFEESGAPWEVCSVGGNC